MKYKSRKQCLDAFCEVVAAAFDAGVRPRCHLEDVTRPTSTASCFPSASG